MFVLVLTCVVVLLALTQPARSAIICHECFVSEKYTCNGVDRLLGPDIACPDDVNVCKSNATGRMCGSPTDLVADDAQEGTCKDEATSNCCTPEDPETPCNTEEIKPPDTDVTKAPVTDGLKPPVTDGIKPPVNDKKPPETIVPVNLICYSCIIDYEDMDWNCPEETTETVVCEPKVTMCKLRETHWSCGTVSEGCRPTRSRHCCYGRLCNVIGYVKVDPDMAGKKGDEAAVLVPTGRADSAQASLRFILLSGLALSAWHVWPFGDRV